MKVKESVCEHIDRLLEENGGIVREHLIRQRLNQLGFQIGPGEMSGVARSLGYAANDGFVWHQMGE